MSADTTPNATFISADGKVSFDDKGYRLDSLGNRTYNNAGIWGESKPRYSKPVQDAIDAYNSEVARYEAERDAFLAQLQQQPGMWSTPAAAATWRQPAQSPWANVSQWQQPGAAPAPSSPLAPPAQAWQPPQPAAPANQWDNVGQWQRPSMPSTQSMPSTADRLRPIATWR